MTRRFILIFIAIGAAITLAIFALRLGGLVRNPTTPTSTPPATQTVSTVAENLEIPWEVAFASDGRMFVTERPGRVRLIKDGKLLPQPALTIDTVPRGEGGLQGLALDPKFSENRFVYLYVSYQEGGGLLNRVVRYRESNDQLSEPKTLLENIPGNNNHNGGRLAFGPDGKLYVTTGDSQEPSLAQDKGSLAGKVLRLDSDGSIPDDNPFGNAVWSYGHRNPQGLAWTKDGDLYQAEHGPSGDLGLCCRDEINRIERGGNYGWPAITADQTKPGMIAPISQSGTDATWAPAGLAAKDDTLYLATLRGTHLRVLEVSGDTVVRTRTFYQDEFGRLRAAVIGPDGDLYLTTSNRDGRGKVRAGDDKLIKVDL